MNEITLILGQTTTLTIPDLFEGYAHITRNPKNIQINFSEDENPSSKVAAALTGDKNPVFTIDSDVFDSIVNPSDSIILSILGLLGYHQEMNQKDVDVLMQKIAELRDVYAPEYIFTMLENMSERDFENFINTDDSLQFFHTVCNPLLLKEDEYEDCDNEE